MAGGRSAGGRWFWVAAGLVVALLICALWVWGQPLFRFLSDQERLRGWVRGFGPWAPVAIALLQFAQVLVAPVPGQAICAASGYLYGLWLGTLYAMSGLLAGSLLVFFVARRFGRPLVARLLRPGTLARLDDLARRGGVLFFFLAWLMPLIPDDLACIAAGLTALPARRLLAVMVLGRLPGVLTAAWIGSTAERLSPLAWAVLLALLALAGVFLWRYGARLQEAMLSAAERIAARIAARLSR